MNTLQKLGYTTTHNNFIKENKLTEFTVGRIINQQKERYLVHVENGIFPAEVTGNLRFSSNSKSDFPVVGDWVLLIDYDESFLIQQVLPRNTILERKAVNADGESQIIASNIDVALIVQSLDHNFNLNRLERYVAVSHAGNIKPIIILNKSDLLTEAELNEKIKAVNSRIKNIEVILSNAISAEGIIPVKKALKASLTYCFIGSSGVGKSSLINLLAGNEILKVNEISESTNKGKHTTTHKELFVLKDGSIVIDTPGMRELGMIDSQSGLEQTFDNIYEFSNNCKFPNCTHTNEPGCAVLDAIENGSLDLAVYENFKKLEREAKYYSASKLEKRKRDKEFGKMAREVMKVKKKTKY